MINRIADLAQLYQEAGRFDDAGTLRDYISRHGGEPAMGGDVSQPEVKANWMHVLGSICIAGYIFSLGLMLLPSWPPRDMLIQPVQPFLGAFGLWQAWNVFSPEIRKENYHLFAIINFTDGSMSIWEFPRQENKTGIEQLRAHRHRKWSQDRVKNNTFGLVMPDTARYLARLHKDRNNPPVSITIAMLSANIPEPRKGSQEPLPPHSKATTLFTYKIREGDLR